MTVQAVVANLNADGSEAALQFLVRDERTAAELTGFVTAGEELEDEP
jgi:hypothetical protein